jgi:hypothetical protein
MSAYGTVRLCARLVAVDRFGEGRKICTYFEVEKGLLKARHGDGVGLPVVTILQ